MKRIKQVFKRFVYNICSLVPFKATRKLADRNLLVVNYHSILGIDPDPFINKNIYRTKDEFERDILYLKKHYSFVDLQQVIAYRIKGAKLPKNSILLTFDDGLSVVYHIIRPLLLKHQVSAVFFINPNFVDNEDLHFQRKKNLILHTVSETGIEKKRAQWQALVSQEGINKINFKECIKQIGYKDSEILDKLLDLFEVVVKQYLQTHSIYLTKQQIKEMIDEGFSFGGHSLDHPKYDELTLEEQEYQTRESIRWVKQTFDLDYAVFAFPLRDHNMSIELFEKFEDDCDLSFGVMGMGDDIVKKHIQRIDVESSSVKISLVLKFNYIKLLFKRLIGNSYYKRPLKYKKH